MPVTKQAKKKLRKDRKREQKNLKVKSDFKKVLKKTKRNVTNKTLSEASKVLDKAAKKGIIHKNKAARLKSRLSKSGTTGKASVSKGKGKAK
jgi:small subunit ribosomal protein S20